MKEHSVKTLSPGETVVDFFLVREKTLATTRTGKPYLTLDLQDATGRIDAKVWDGADTFATLFQKGDVIKVQALVETYQGRNQLNIRQLRRARDDDPFDYADLLPATDKDVSILWEKLDGYIASVQNPWLAKLLAAFFDNQTFRDDFARSVAARDVHHAYVGGLIEHTVSVVDVADFFAHHYAADRDLLITGAILHDIGKIRELESTREFNYTVAGGMIGHITLGVQMASERIASIEGFPEELAMLVNHMILSHQGQPDWGSPIPPKTREAVLLHFADNVDAKHRIALKALSQTPADSDPFTPRVRYMGHSFYRGLPKKDDTTDNDTPEADEK